MYNNISVIIPFYNSEKTIQRCLVSVTNQTLKPSEIILIDDGSVDNSVNIIESFFDDNIEVNYKLISKINGGVSSARNVGLKIANGDLIAFLDSDDEWINNKLEIQVSCFVENENCHFVGGLIYENKNVSNIIIRKISVLNLVFKNYFQPSTVIFKREIINTIGLFDEKQKYAEEGNYFIRIASKYNCYLLNKQLVIYDRGRRGFGISGLSSNIYEMEKGELLNLNYAKKNKLISMHVYFLAYLYSILKFIRRILIVKYEKYVK